MAGVMVSIAAFQAVDPGSIPGPRNFVLGKKCSMRGSNPRLLAHKTNTLPTELMELHEHIPKKTAVCGDRTHALTNMRLKHAP